MGISIQVSSTSRHTLGITEMRAARGDEVLSTLLMDLGTPRRHHLSILAFPWCKIVYYPFHRCADKFTVTCENKIMLIKFSEVTAMKGAISRQNITS